MWPSKPSIATTRIGRTYLWLASAILLSQHALADCECGYSTSVSNSTDTQQQQQQSFVFTDLIEANFANVSDISKNTDWVRQEFNTSASQARGTYGEIIAVDNVEAREGGDGLQITVRSDVVEGMLSGGEIDSARLDVFYGSFRSSLKLTDVGGTVCWYPACMRRRYVITDEFYLLGIGFLLGKWLYFVMPSGLWSGRVSGRMRLSWPQE